MAIPQMVAAFVSFVSMTGSRIIANVVSKKIDPPNQAGLAKQSQNQQSRKAEAEYLRGKAKREQELVKIQADLAKMREIEIRAGMEIAAAQAEREERALEISEKELQLKKQALQLAKERLKQEGQVAEVQQQQVERVLQLRERELEILAEERAQRLQLSYLHLQLVQDNKAREIDLKLKEIQAGWDKENWSGLLSREEMRQILIEGRQKHRLLMLVSPPDIEGCPEFDSNLHKAVRSELKEFMEKYYPLHSDLCPVEFYGKFFKSSVFDTEVKQYERDLAPIPTVVIYSDVTNDKVYFHIHVWGLAEPVSMTFPWNWREERDKLEASEGKTRDESLRIIRDALVKSHQLLAAFLADLYYLEINPSHEIRLFQLDGNFPSEWIKSQFQELSRLQQEKIASYGGSLMNSQDEHMVNLSDTLPTPRLALRMRDQSKIIQPGSPTIYQLPIQKDMEDTKSQLSKCHIGQPRVPEPQEKVLMVVGATGAGKTTLINGMVNYILGVEWEDDFRFKLIADEGGKSQTQSQTKWITAYTLHPMQGSRLPYKLTIIDTPGFGDTEGLKRDKLITDQIREFFSAHGLHGIDHLEGVGFVTQSSLARLTPTQKYIFDSILSIFGKDLANNIFILITFADGNKPPVIKAVKEADVPYSQYFKFNNSAMFPNDIATEEEDEEEERDEEVNAMFWQIGYKSFEKFFTEFEKAESISLTLTKDVLKERKQLEILIEGLLPQIKAGLAKLNQLQQEEAILEQHKADINANKNFTYSVKVPKTRRVSISTGYYVTNCLQCNRTCHDSCAFSDDADKYKCSAMNNGGKENAVCTVCPGKCSWQKHVNRPYKFEDYEETETRTFDDLKKRYNTAVSGKNKVESIINGLNRELQAVCEEVFRMIQRAQQSLHRLDKIALKRNPLTEVQYIDILIESEKQEAKLGWEQRVAYYQEARECAQLLSNMKNATDIEKEQNIKKWAEKLISKLKQEKSKTDGQTGRSNPKTGRQPAANPTSWWPSFKRPFS